MAEMCPVLSDAELRGLPSQAEARFYRAARDQLGAQVLVFHSLRFVTAARRARPADGEADFVIFDEQHGILVVEVKGGGVRYEPNTDSWWSLDAAGTEHKIRDPFKQAVKEKYAIHEQLSRDAKCAQLGLTQGLIGHAVLLADIDDPKAINHAAGPHEILGGRGDLADVRAWVDRVLSFWQGHKTHMPLGKPGMQAIHRLFCEPIEVRPLLSARIAAEEEIRIRLTEQQGRILRALGLHPRAAICGGAGTGKTLLAVAKARELAVAGLRTLLVCYNRPLADHLQSVVGTDSNLVVAGFHQLCEWRAQLARDRSSVDLMAEAAEAYPGRNKYDVHYPMALARSTEVLDEQFDALVVDEGQDFREDFWLPLQLLLRHGDDAPFYIFYDDNQCMYQCASTFPLQDQPYTLTVNCRNTRTIHEAAYRFFRGSPTEAPEIHGAPINRICADDLGAQAAKIHSLVCSLMTREKVAPEQVTVLIAGSPRQTYEDCLCSRPLPAGTSWSRGQHRLAKHVLVETIRRFKGLEAEVVVLWGADGLSIEAYREIFYVGLSRAKAHLYVVGTSATCDSLLKVPADRDTWGPLTEATHNADAIL